MAASKATTSLSNEADLPKLESARYASQLRVALLRSEVKHPLGLKPDAEPRKMLNRPRGNKLLERLKQRKTPKDPLRSAELVTFSGRERG